MPTVLDNFRKQYPEYSDIPDLELATKLASKYPEYSDVLQEVQSTKEKPKRDLLGKKPPVENWVKAGLEQTKRDLIDIPVAHFGNQFLLNAPRALANQAGADYPEAESGVGTVLSKAAGVAGAVMNPLSALRAFQAMKAGGALLPKVMQGAKAGAIQGAAYTPTEDIVGLQQRLGGGLVGGALGGTGSVIANTATQVGRMLNRLKVPNRIKDPEGYVRYQRSNENIIRKINNRIKVLQDKASQIKTSTTNDGGVALKAIDDQILAEKNNLTQNTGEVIQLMKENVTKLKEDFTNAVQTGAIDIQKKLPAFFKANSQSYGKELDAISDAVGDNFTRGTANDIIETTLKELDDINLADSAWRKAIDKFKEKYGLQVFDKKGELIAELDPNTPVNFKQFKNDISSLWKKTTGEAKAGQKYRPDDLPTLILQKNFGEYASTKIPKFAELQAEYRPVIQAMKEAGAYFKPYAGDFKNIPGGNKFVERIANGTTSPQDKLLIQMLSKGSKFASGIGDLANNAKLVAMRLSAAEKALSQSANKTSPQLQSLFAQKEMLKRKMQIMIDKEMNPYKEGVSALNKRKTYAQMLQDNKKKANDLKRNALAVGAATAGLLGLGGAAVMQARTTVK